MECLNCKIINMPDARFCRKCGEPLRRCVTCAVAHEEDALYCRKCGKPIDHPHENHAGAPAQAGSDRAADGPDFDADVDFTTKVSPKRVEPIPRARGSRRIARSALYVAVLVLAVALTVVATSWGGAPASSPEVNEQVEGLRAELEEYRKMVAETKDAERRSILQDIGSALARMRAEERKATNEEIKKAIARTREEERKTIGEEIAKAVARVRARDHDFIIAQLTKLKAKSKNREFSRRIERMIALFRTGGKLGADARPERADD
jgi:hypothetical protein